MYYIQACGEDAEKLNIMVVVFWDIYFFFCIIKVLNDDRNVRVTEWMSSFNVKAVLVLTMCINGFSIKVKFHMKSYDIK